MAAIASVPFERVQHLVDQAALVSMYAVPHSAHSRVSAEEIRTVASLQRFESIASPAEPGHRLHLEHAIEQALRKVLDGRMPVATPCFTVRQQIGESAGTLELEARWTSPAADGVQCFSVTRARFGFGETDWAQGEGVGRLYPTVDGCQSANLFVAAGKISRASGKLHGLAGTFALNGRLDELGSFVGVVTCRFFDPGNRVRTSREIEAPLGFADPARATFLELRVANSEARKASIVEFADGKARLMAEFPARGARFVSECKGHRGLQSKVVRGLLVGGVEAAFEMEAGKDPVSGLSARYRYRVDSANGECAGTLDLTVEESVVIEPDLPGEIIRMAQFAGIGRIGGGTGVFEGAGGVFAENSAFAFSPPALSLMHVTQIADAIGRFRTAP